MKLRIILSSIFHVTSQIIFVLMLAYGAQAQKKYEFSYRHIGDEFGLSQNTVTNIVQDSLGYLWMATNDGLNRYNGLSIEVFKYERDDSTSLSNGWINTLLYDKSGRLWAGTNRGLNIFNSEEQNFIHVPTDTSKRETLNGVPHEHIFSLSQDSKGRIWVATWSSLVYTYDGITFHKPKFASKSNYPIDYINKVVEGKDGTLWIGLFDSGLLKYDEKKDTLIHYASIRVEGRYDFPKDILSITEDPVSGDIWLGTRQSGLFRFDPKTENAYSYASVTTEGAAFGANIHSQMHYKGRFWVGNSLGFFEYNREKDTFTEELGFTEDKTYYRVFSMYLDRSENLWIGTELNGSLVIDLKPKKFKSIGNHLLPSPIIWSIYEDIENQLWVVTETGLAVLNKDFTKSTFVLDKINEPIRAVGDFIISVTGKDDTIWIGTTFSGVYEINRKTKVYTKVKDKEIAKSKYINVIEYNKHYDLLFVGSVSGMGVYNLNTKELDWFKHDKRSEKGIPVNTIWDFYFANDSTVWITHDEGISRYDVATKSFYNFKIFPEEKAINPSQTTNMMTEDKNGNLWVGTENGLVYYNRFIDSTLYVYTMKDGLSNDYIYGIARDSLNSIWVSTNRGISQLIDDSTMAHGKRIRNYSQFDGLSSSEFNFNAFTISKNGQFFFGGINGVNYFNPNDIENNKHKPSQQISELRINTGSTDYSFHLKPNDEIEFDYGSHVYEILMNALEFTSPEENVYRFRLVGFDTHWREKTGKNSVIYTNLNPGDYQFEFIASNNDKVFSDKISNFKLRIIPPFYKTAQFYIFIVVFTCLIIYWGISYREKKLVQQNEFLEREVKNRTRELEKNEFIFRQISDNAADLISMLDPNGMIFYSSPSHETLLGYTPNEVINKNAFDFIHPDDSPRIREELKKLSEVGLLTLSEYRMKHKNGTWRTYNTAGSLIRYDDENDYRFVMISHDITRQKRIENYLIESKNDALKANQAKSAFLAGISHELRTPLNAILGFSQILSKETNLTPRQVSYIETMLKSGNHLLDMINEVLDISRIEAGKMPINFDNFSLTQLLSDIDNLFRLDVQAKGLELLIETQPDLPDFCFSDAGKIRQVVINLVGNASKFTTSGFVKVRACYQRDISNVSEEYSWSAIEANLTESYGKQATKGLLCISVEDSGRGISEDKLKEIFEPFQQANSKINYSEGTGLGLAISSRLIKLLNGSIDLKSELGKGSIFNLKIPVYEVETPAMIVNEPLNKLRKIKDNRNPKILIVDDIEYNHTLLKELLGPIGFICSTVYNGKEAIEMTELFKPDLILMDLRMPVMDGVESTKIIRLKHKTDVKILAISASGFDNNSKDPKKSGFDDFLLKPFKETILYQKLAELLNIEYEFLEYDQFNRIDTKQNESLKIVEEIESMGNFGIELLEEIDVADWDALSNRIQHMEEYPLIHSKIKEALTNKDFMALLTLSEMWENSKES